MAATQSNSADTKVFFAGDSTTEGFGGQNNGIASNCFTGSVSVQIASLVANASWQPTFFDHNIAGVSSMNGFDNRFSPDAGCGVFNINGLAGGAVGSSDPNTDGFHLTPTTSFDTLDIGYDTSGNGGSFTVGYDGGGVSSTISPQASNGFQISTITTTLGVHTIDVKNVSQSAGSLIQFIVPRKSATKQVLMMNGGIAGARSSDFLSQSPAYKYLAALITLAPHVVILEAGIINDWVNAVSVITSQANITTIVNALLPTTDVILTTGVPSDSATVAQATQVQYQQMILALARVLGVPCIDTFGKFVDFATSNGLGWMSDNLHPSFAGYTVQAAMKANVLNNPGFLAA